MTVRPSGGAVGHVDPAGVVVGVLSTFAGLAVAELVAGLFRGARRRRCCRSVRRSSTPRPRWSSDGRSRPFGTADKAVLIVGTLFSLIVIGSIVGILAVQGRRIGCRTP